MRFRITVEIEEGPSTVDGLPITFVEVACDGSIAPMTAEQCAAADALAWALFDTLQLGTKVAVLRGSHVRQYEPVEILTKPRTGGEPPGRF